MTRGEILALSGRDGDAAIALHVMGMAPMRDGFDNLLYWVGKGEPTGDLDSDEYAFVPYYFSDANAARLVLAEIERLGDEYALVRRLRVVEPSLPDVALEYGEYQVWDVLKLTPEQLCQAALLAVEGV